MSWLLEEHGALADARADLLCTNMRFKSLNAIIFRCRFQLTMRRSEGVGSETDSQIMTFATTFS